MIDQHLRAMILRQQGQNTVLANEIIEKLTPQSKERLYRIFQKIENEYSSLERKAKQPWRFMR